MSEIDNEIPGNEAEADALLESIEAPRVDPEAAPQANAQAAPAPSDDYELTVGGKSIKAKRDQVMRWAQQGYDAPNKIGSLTKELETWKQKESKFGEMEKKYGPVDEYVRQNPQFWDHVVKQYEQRGQALADQNNPLAQEIQTLRQNYEALTQQVNPVIQTMQQERMKNEDQAYTQELTTIQKQYPQIDFSTPDENGLSLEYKVLQHATENGIKKFTTAFRDFHHDELMKIQAESAKEQVAKERQKNTKLGILGKSPTPTRQVRNDVRGKSYGDLEREALEELGLAN